MTALMHNASVTYKACIYFPDKADGPLVDALITEQIAKHQLGQAAVAKFGDDGNGLVNEPQNSDESLQKALDKMKNGIVETKGEWAVLRENAERFGSSANFRKVDGLWKIDHSRYVAFLAKDREHNQAGMVANARVMEELTQQIKAGAFKDVEEAKATLALKKIAASFGVEHVARWWRGRKPSPQGLHEAMARLAVTPKQTVMIGDQLLTDMWAGCRAGVYTILVTPISPVEFAGTKVTRFFERILLWLLKRRKLI